MASGKYTAFIDDDDMIAPDYLDKVIDGMATDPDAIGLVGIISIMNSDGTKHKSRFYHTIQNSSYYTSNRGYERPPNHLNPIRRSIASKFDFPEKNFGEDTEWAMAVCHSKLIRTEYFIDTPLYFYDYNPHKTY